MSQPIPLPPFQAFLASNIPSVYDNTLSYYDELTKLIAYLEQQVVPAVNANTAGLEQLKSYVDDYFKNLDLQEEIDKKLDEMAESGELAEIVTAYLELKGVLAYDTPVDLKAATNLIEGSYAKTFGYKRKGDGVYDLYVVRAKEEGDVDDGYNTIILTNDDTLAAIRLPQQGKRIINIIGDDNIQDYLSLEGEKEIVLPKATTITVTEALLLNSNTTIDLNESTINFSYARSDIFDYNWDETLGFMGYGPNDTFKKYNGHRNIIIKNGSITGGCCCFLHNKNVLFESVYFQTAGARHSIQLAACNNFTVKDCTFEGARDDSQTNASELINIDICEFGAQPYISQYSVMWDGTKNFNFTADNNYFLQTNLEGLGYFSAVGTHGGSDTTDTICEKFTVTKNDFGNPREYAIGLKNYNDVLIEGNFLDDKNSTYLPKFILKRGIVNRTIITNNDTRNIEKFFDILSPAYQGNEIEISNNLIIAKDGNYDATAVFMLINIHDSSISYNTVEYQHHPFHVNTRGYFDNVDDNPNDHTINVTIEGNTFEKTVASAVYFGCRINASSNLRIINNDYIHDASLQSNWYELLLQGTQTNIAVQSNSTDAPEKFVNPASLTGYFGNNNALYTLVDSINTADTSGTLIAGAGYFSTFKLVLGGSSNTQVVELGSYLPTYTRLNDRVYKLPVAKNDGTYGVATFTISNSGANWAYTGDINLRAIVATD